MITIKYNFNGEIYEYEVSPTFDDFADYLTPDCLKEVKCYKDAIKKTIDNFGVNWEKVKEDDYFIEFLKKRYEEVARQEFENDL